MVLEKLINIVSLFFLSLVFLIYSSDSSAKNIDLSNVTTKYDYDLSDSEVMVLGLLVKNISTNDALLAYKFEGKIYVPLLEFTSALRFPTEFQYNEKSNKKIISGWYINKDITFNFDLNSGVLISRDNRYNLGIFGIKKFKEDIYIELSLLENFFDLEINYSSLEQRLEISTNEILPIERKLLRRKRWKSREKELRQNIDDSLLTGVRELKAPYELASIPTVDLRYNYNHNKNKNSRRDISTVNALVNGDFLYLNNQISLNTENDILSDAFISSGRKDDDGGLLGPMDATEFRIGDIYSQQVPLVANSRVGVGARVTNFPSNYVVQANTVSIRGVSQPGWDIEIYRNGFLIDFQTTESDGQYDFANFPLLAGNNIIKITSYGPFGEVREETREYNINPESLLQGKLYYNFSTNKNQKRLVRGHSPGEDLNRRKDEFGRDRHFAELAYGLTKFTSIHTKYIEIPDPDSEESKIYNSIGVKGSIDRFIGQFDVYRDSDTGDKAYETFLATRIKNSVLSTKVESFQKDFISERRINNSRPVKEIEMKLDMPIFLPFMKKSIRSSFSRTQEKFAQKGDRIVDEINLSISISKLKISQRIRMIEDKSKEHDTKTDSGETIINYKINSKLSIRSDIRYNVEPNKGFTSYGITANYNLKDTLKITSGLQYNFATANSKSTTNYNANITKQIGDFAFTVGGRLGKDEYAMNMNFALSIGYDPSNKDMKIYGSSISNKGSILVRAFLDKNGDGIYNEGEELLEGVDFEVNNSRKNIHTTTENGTAFIAGLKPDSVSTIKLVNKLDNFYWSSLEPVLKIRTHSGALTKVDFPVSIVGEVLGYVSINRNDQNVRSKGVVLELVDEEDKVVKVSESSDDGFFYFDMVSIGRYTIRVQEQWSEDVGYGNSDYRNVIVGLDENDRGIDVTGFVLNKNKPKKKVAREKIKLKKWIGTNGRIYYRYYPVKKYNFSGKVKKGEVKRIIKAIDKKKYSGPRADKQISEYDKIKEEKESPIEVKPRSIEENNKKVIKKKRVFKFKKTKEDNF